MENINLDFNSGWEDIHVTLTKRVVPWKRVVGVCLVTWRMQKRGWSGQVNLCKGAAH